MFSSEVVERAMSRIPSTIDVVTTDHISSPASFGTDNSNSIIMNNKKRTRVTCNNSVSLSDLVPPLIRPGGELKLPYECHGHLIVDFDEVVAPSDGLIEAQRNFDLLRRYSARKRQKKSNNHVDPSVMALAISTASIVDAEVHHLLNGIAELESLLGDNSKGCSPNIVDRSPQCNLGYCMRQNCVISQNTNSVVDRKPDTPSVRLQRSISSSTSSSSLCNLKGENDKLPLC